MAAKPSRSAEPAGDSSHDSEESSTEESSSNESSYETSESEYETDSSEDQIESKSPSKSDDPSPKAKHSDPTAVSSTTSELLNDSVITGHDSIAVSSSAAAKMKAPISDARSPIDEASSNPDRMTDASLFGEDLQTADTKSQSPPPSASATHSSALNSQSLQSKAQRPTSKTQSDRLPNERSVEMKKSSVSEDMTKRRSDKEPESSDDVGSSISTGESSVEDSDDSSSVSSGEISSDSSEEDSVSTADEEEEEAEPQLKYLRLAGDVHSTILGDQKSGDSATCLAVHSKFLVLATQLGWVYILDHHGERIRSDSSKSAGAGSAGAAGVSAASASDASSGASRAKSVGGPMKEYRAHSCAVQDVCIDDSGEFIASCAKDGRVVIRDIYKDVSVVHSFQKQELLSVRIHPSFSESSNKKFVCGGMNQELLLRSIGYFMNDTSVLHSGEGPIYRIVWNGPSNLIAWANDHTIKLFDAYTNQPLAQIQRHIKGPPDYHAYQCCLCFEDPHTLLIGWADWVKIAKIVEERTIDGGFTKVVSVVEVFITDYIICGIAPFGEHLVLLAYVDNEEDSADEDSDSQEFRRKEKKAIENGSSKTRKKSVTLANPPEFKLVTRKGQWVASDALPIRNYQYMKAKDYSCVWLNDAPSVSSSMMIPSRSGIASKLDRDTTLKMSQFYIVSKEDILVALPRTVKDHLGWLTEKEKFEDAWLESLRCSDELDSDDEVYSPMALGNQFLRWLLNSATLEEKERRFGPLCQEICGDNAERWEEWIQELKKFTPSRSSASPSGTNPGSPVSGGGVSPPPSALSSSTGVITADSILAEAELSSTKVQSQLYLIYDYVPYREPCILKSEAYLEILNELLVDQKKHGIFLDKIKMWPQDIYDASVILDQALFHLDTIKSNTLVSAVAELHKMSGDWERALQFYLQLSIDLFSLNPGHFDLIAILTDQKKRMMYGSKYEGMSDLKAMVPLISKRERKRLIKRRKRKQQRRKRRVLFAVEEKKYHCDELSTDSDDDDLMMDDIYDGDLKMDRHNQELYDSDENGGGDDTAFIHALSHTIDIDGSENVSLTLTSSTLYGSKNVRINFSLEAWLLQSKMANYLKSEKKYLARYGSKDLSTASSSKTDSEFHLRNAYDFLMITDGLFDDRFDYFHYFHHRSQQPQKKKTDMDQMDPVQLQTDSDSKMARIGRPLSSSFPPNGTIAGMDDSRRLRAMSNVDCMNASKELTKIQLEVYEMIVKYRLYEAVSIQKRILPLIELDLLRSVKLFTEHSEFFRIHDIVKTVRNKCTQIEQALETQTSALGSSVNAKKLSHLKKDVNAAELSSLDDPASISLVSSLFDNNAIIPEQYLNYLRFFLYLYLHRMICEKGGSSSSFSSGSGGTSAASSSLSGDGTSSSSSSKSTDSTGLKYPEYHDFLAGLYALFNVDRLKHFMNVCSHTIDFPTALVVCRNRLTMLKLVMTKERERCKLLKTTLLANSISQSQSESFSPVQSKEQHNSKKKDHKKTKKSVIDTSVRKPIQPKFDPLRIDEELIAAAARSNGSLNTLMVSGDEDRKEVDAEEQTNDDNGVVNETTKPSKKSKMEVKKKKLCKLPVIKSNLIKRMHRRNVYIYEEYHKLVNYCIVFVLNRMGNYNEALQTYLTELKDMKMAVSYVESRHDPSMWTRLIESTLKDATELVPKLLDALKSHPKEFAKNLIELIPDEMVIDQLRQRIMAIFEEYSRKKSLWNGTTNILRTDCRLLSHRLYEQSKRGIAVTFEGISPTNNNSGSNPAMAMLENGKSKGSSSMKSSYYRAKFASSTAGGIKSPESYNCTHCNIPLNAVSVLYHSGLFHSGDSSSSKSGPLKRADKREEKKQSGDGAGSGSLSESMGNSSDKTLVVAGGLYEVSLERSTMTDGQKEDIRNQPLYKLRDLASQKPPLIGFFCGHMYHLECFEEACIQHLVTSQDQCLRCHPHPRPAAHPSSLRQR